MLWTSAPTLPSKLFPLLKIASSNWPTLRIFLTSRPSPEIRSEIRSLSGPNFRTFEDEISPDDTKSDIEQLLKTHRDAYAATNFSVHLVNCRPESDEVSDALYTFRAGNNVLTWIKSRRQGQTFAASSSADQDTWLLWGQSTVSCRAGASI